MPHQSKRKSISEKVKKDNANTMPPHEPVEKHSSELPIVVGGSLDVTEHSVQNSIVRVQALINERIEHVRDRLRFTEEALQKVQSHEARICELEAELHELRKADKNQMIRINQLETENASLRTRLSTIQSSLVAAEMRARHLKEVVSRLYKVAGEEIGRAVKTLLAAKNGGILKKKLSLSEQAKILTDSHIVDTNWYLSHHPDVAAVGMDPALHYILHGAEEGRLAHPAIYDVSDQDLRS